MASNTAADPELPADQQEEGGEELAQQDPFWYAITNQAPWWFVSILMHVLIIALASLVSMAVDLGEEREPLVTITALAPRQELNQEKPKIDSKFTILSSHDTAPTDPDSNDPSDIVVPPDILAKAELGDHWETINPDKPDTHSAFGNPDAHMFHSVSGSDDAAGGGGMGGNTLEDVIGFGGGASPGTGGGWGGGNGTGIGVDNGPGHGSFGQRNGGGRRLMVKRHGGSHGTESSVDSALHWLAYHQEQDGHWDARKYTSEQQTDTACTGLALLAFLGAGHTEKVGEYKDNVRRAVAWLKSKQQANGMIFDATDAGGWRGEGYPHAIASLAMAEAAGMANVPETRDAAQKSITYSTETHQVGEGADKLAWRYHAKEAPDTSVSGWFIMSLKSAKVAGLNVNHAAFDGAIKWLDSVEHKGTGGDPGYGPASTYWYQTNAEHSETQHRLTAIGCLSRQFLGWKKEDLQSTVDGFVAKGGVPNYGHVDLYYWYYGTLCVFQQGGDVWKRWNEAMKACLTTNQRKDGDETGSWDPKGDFATEWGRVGQTALSCLCLEVYYRYLQLSPDR